MKKLHKINLHNLSQAELQNREMNMLKGGVLPCECDDECDCPCLYSAPDQEHANDPSYYGGSSTSSNSAANYQQTDSEDRMYNLVS